MCSKIIGIKYNLKVSLKVLRYAWVRIQECFKAVVELYLVNLLCYSKIKNHQYFGIKNPKFRLAATLLTDKQQQKKILLGNGALIFYL